MKFTDNDHLFGADRTENIVAIEFSEPNIAEVFIRQPHGATEVVREEFEPFLWNDADGEELAGKGALRFLRRFSSWLDLQDAKNYLQKAGSTWFTFNDPVQQYLTTSGRTLFKGMDFTDLRRLQISVTGGETIQTISLSDSTGWSETRAVAGPEEERDAISWLNKTIAERDPDVIEGHHLFKLDLAFLSARAKRLKIKLTWGRGGEPMTSRASRLQIAEKTIQYPKFVVRGRHLVDTWILAQYYDISSRSLEHFGLAGVASHLGIVHDPGVAQIQAISATLSRSYFIQAQIFPYNYQDTIIRGNATKIDALFLREYLRQGYALPNVPEARHFEGGYTDIFETGIMKDVWHCDVTSLYPSLMLSFGYLPATDELGVFGGMLRDLRTFRIEAKNALRGASDSTERSRLDALQTTFKILINSFYGYMGFGQGHFADFDIAEQITAKGREILRQMVDWLTKEGCKVIEIDTDGIYFQAPARKPIEDLRNGLAVQLPKGIDVEFDEHYAAMFSYKAKNYALLDHQGAVTIKGGALKSRGMEPFLRDYLEQLLRLLLEGKSSEASALRDQIAAQIRGRQLPLEALARTESLQDSPANYLKKIGASSRNKSAAFELAIKSGRNYQAGDQVSYYITGTKKKVTAYENARLVEEWNAEARDENAEYYVGKLEELAKKFDEYVKPDAGPELNLF